MTFNQNRPEDEYADKFTEAAENWDLERLYADLEKAKQQQPERRNEVQLTPFEKACLRGLLCGESSLQIAKKLSREPRGLRVDLSRGLYQYLKTLTGQEQINNWRDIPRWLEKAGYKQKRPPQPSNSPDPYVERPPIEERCYEEIGQPGALLRIKAPKGMGKTWLLNKILTKAQSQGYHKVYISLLNANEKVLNDLDSFLRWFCKGIRQGLRLPTQLPESGEFSTFDSQECKTYFEYYVLTQIDSPLVLGLDVVDRLFPYPIAVDFLSMLRSWHEEAKSYDIWNKLRLVMAYSTEVYIPIDAHSSPFNVGESVELLEFNQEQVNDLSRRYKLELGSTSLEKLMDAVGGHPYLVGLTFKEIPRRNASLEELLPLANMPSGIYYNHLQKLLDALTNRPELAEAMKQVVDANEPVTIEADELAFQLYSLGLVKFNKNGGMPSCKLYRQYFRDRLRRA
ncbi:MAG TPA: hypothetical protein DDZ80_32645 [Cyanobacteria bacterium UBA8803]|nr:hypothetical protein [Cyanobacteria bacterium UBA9273]HBL62948.1 hypothetical protein [Cyanobacteria bacterium UBA8803]